MLWSIPCPEIPPLGSGDYPEAGQFVDALAEATRALPGVRADRLALVGHSRGGGAVLPARLPYRMGRLR